MTFSARSRARGGRSAFPVPSRALSSCFKKRVTRLQATLNQIAERRSEIWKPRKSGAGGESGSRLALTETGPGGSSELSY